MSLNSEIADLFAQMAALMELKGDNLFKVIAFQKVSRIIRDFNIDLRHCFEQGTLCDIEGIGKSSQRIIEEYIQTGKSTDYLDLASTVPAGLIPLLTIEGLGPKTINLLWKQCRVTSLDELDKAIANGKVACLKGMGEKKIQNILHGIELYKSRSAGTTGPIRIGIVEALAPAEELLAADFQGDIQNFRRRGAWFSRLPGGHPEFPPPRGVVQDRGARSAALPWLLSLDGLSAACACCSFQRSRAGEEACSMYLDGAAGEKDSHRATRTATTINPAARPAGASANIPSPRTSMQTAPTSSPAAATAIPATYHWFRIALPQKVPGVQVSWITGSSSPSAEMTVMDS